ncbi:MAG: glycosyl hydrolase [Clostridia bacterium]|nr:glycosyl hydrolase [Clostridia bacterium]
MRKKIIVFVILIFVLALLISCTPGSIDADNNTDIVTGNDFISDTESNYDAQTDISTEIDTEYVSDTIITETNIEAETDSETVADTEKETEVETDVESDTETTFETDVESDTETKFETDTEKIPEADKESEVLGETQEGISVTDLYIDGTPISDFKLYTESVRLDNRKIVDALKSSGIVEEMDFDNKMRNGRHYIVIDNTGLDYNGYKYEVKDGNLYITGSYSNIYKTVEYFVHTFLASKNSPKYNLTSADNCSGSMGKGDFYTKDELMTLLTKVYNDPNKIIIGEQATSDGVDACIKHFKNGTGQKPGMVGIDLTSYGFDLTKATDEEISEQLCLIVEYVAAGGIINISTHFTNPSGNIPKGDYQNPRGTLGKTGSLDAYEKAFKDVITPGTAYNKALHSELDGIGEFLKALDDAGIAAMYRPFHEMNGYWFWWCVGQNNRYVSSDTYVALWKYVYSYLVNDLGIDNLLWVYAPDIQSNVSNAAPGTYDKSFCMPTTYCYPGDDYCDIVGVDWYTREKTALEITHNNSYLNIVNASGKIGAITEFGPRDNINRNYIYGQTGKLVDQKTLFSALDLYNNLVALRDKGYSFCYILTWHNHWSIPYYGYGDQFMAKDMTLGLDEVSALFEKVSIDVT